MNIVPIHRTSITPAMMATQIARLYSLEHGRRPTARFVAWLMTLLWHEHRGGEAVQNHNWGNLAAGPSWDGDAWAYPNALQAGEPAHFRAYPDHDAGALAWWNTLHSETNRRILEAAERGTLDDFFRAVATPHPRTGMSYCTSCPPEVRTSYGRIHDQILKSGYVSGFPAGRMRAAASQGGGGLLLVAVLGIGAILWGVYGRH